MGILSTTLVYFAVFFIGYVIGLNRAVNAVMNLTKKNIGDLIPVYIASFEEGSYYLYDKNSAKFICQGKTLDEVAIALNNAKKIFAIVATSTNDDLKLQWFINGKFKEFQ